MANLCRSRNACASIGVQGALFWTNLFAVVLFLGYGGMVARDECARRPAFVVQRLGS
jgi:hypothetical protein